MVVAGTVDRLLVTEALVRIVDFKTGSRVPMDADSAPVYHFRQMAAYAAALEPVFPGRAVEANLLYTAGPKWIKLNGELQDRHRQGPSPAINDGRCFAPVASCSRPRAIHDLKSQ